MTSKAELTPSITVSIVSHGHGQQVAQLVDQVLRDPLVSKLVVTFNVPEDLDLPEDQRLVRIDNNAPKGFGRNHNSAFVRCATPFYCVLNPDIVLRKTSFADLLCCLKNSEAAVAGPLVVSPMGDQEDSWRRFPTVFSLCLKALGSDITIMKQSDPNSPLFPDWIAGMCMLFKADSYSAINGFDERLFLYYEDVDICARLWKSNQAVVVSSKAKVIHNAQRASRRKFEHMRWHLSSMAKYLAWYSFRMPRPDRNHSNGSLATHTNRKLKSQPK
jgi:N-acetylglucosaminyl-diphospho-decaprenol L-rhamnosyltransferase